MDNCRAAGGCSPSDGDCPLSVFLSTIAIRHVMNPQGDNCPLSIINCQLSIESPVLTSQFPDSAFSANAYFRHFVPIRKTSVKYFKIRPSERIRINVYSYNYTISNAKKASAAPVSTLKSTCDWLRTDERLPSYRRVRTVVVVRPYENTHLSPFFRDRRGTISDV